MRAATYVLLGAAVTTSCLRSTAFKCVEHVDCGAAGVCEAIGYCSFPNAACADSGRSFGDSASPELANACVPAGEPGIDAGVDGRSDAALPVGCPADYAPVAGSAHSYKVLDSSSWGAAADRCKMASMAAYLAVPGDSTELMNLAAIASPPIWIGVDDQAIHGEFVTQNGEPATFLPWQGGEPGAASESCVEALTPTKIGTGVCGTLRVAICECDP
jgi:hypothetical protein